MNRAHKLITILLFLVSSVVLFGQSEYNDVIYLKNGSITVGKVIEKDANQRITIITKTGVKFTYEDDEIDRMTIGVTPELNIDTNTKNDFETKQKVFFGLSFGPTINLGNPSGNDRNVSPGLNFSIPVIGYFITENIGMALRFSLGLQENDPFSQGSYWGVFLGPMYSLHIQKRLSIDFRPMVGLISANDPDYSFSSPKEAQSSFGWNPSLGIRLHLTNRYSLMVNMDGVFGTITYPSEKKINSDSFVISFGGSVRF